MADKSKILIIGATGHIGKHIVRASSKAGHPTFALIRQSTLSDPQKSVFIDSFRNSGVTLLYGDIDDHESLVKAIKQVDIVISAVGIQQIAQQVNLIAAIKEAGNVKRFLPSEFGANVEGVQSVEPASSFFELKTSIRRAIEAEEIPFTYIVSHGFAGSFLPNFGDYNAKAPPREKVSILGDGNHKAIVVKEEDIAEYTIKAVDDPRTLNKILYLRPPANVLSFNEIASLWEKKIGKTLEKTHIPEDRILRTIKESAYPFNLYASFSHSTFVIGAPAVSLESTSVDVDASELYPDVKYTTVDEYLDQFV